MPTFTVEESSGFAVCHDGKPLTTPAGAPLVVPAQGLAKAIVAEEPPLKGRPNLKDKPFLQLAFTAIDITAKAREKTIDDIMNYAGSELLCHRAEQPQALVRQQTDMWQPLLDWCAQEFDAPLKTGTGVMPIAQPPESLQALRKVITAYDDFRLTGLSQAVHASGSLVLGLALATRHLSGDEVSHAADLDAMQQMQDWGEDPAIRERIVVVRAELKHLERWFALLDIK